MDDCIFVTCTFFTTTWLEIYSHWNMHMAVPSFLLLCWAVVNYINITCGMGFPRSSVGKKSACNAGDLGSIPGSGRCPGEGNGNPLQYSCLENPMDRGVWWATVRGVTRVGHN